MRAVRRVLVAPPLILLVFALAAAAGGTGDPAAADCTEPTITVDPPGGPPGANITVSGKGFWQDCHDPSSPSSRYVASRPDTDIQIFFAQDGQAVEVGRVNAAPDGSFQIVVPVPADAGPGPAEVSASGTNGRPAQSFAVSAPPPPTAPPPVTTAPTAPAPAPQPAPTVAARPATTGAPRRVTPRAAGSTSRGDGTRAAATVTSVTTVTSLTTLPSSTLPDLDTTTSTPPTSAPDDTSTTGPSQLALHQSGDRGSGGRSLVLGVLVVAAAGAFAYLAYNRRRSPGWGRRW